jgi:hypothetical protein
MDDVSILVVGIMALAGLASIAYAALAWKRRLKAAERSASWPVAEGTILSATIVHERNYDSPDEYVPLVRYRYLVGGRRLESDRLRAGGRTAYRDETRALAAIQFYKTGDEVRVRYDPLTPESSVLEVQPASTGLRGWLFFGIVLLAFAGYAALTVTLPKPAWLSRMFG